MVSKEFTDFFVKKMLEASEANEKLSHDNLLRAEKLATAKEVLRKLSEAFPSFIEEFEKLSSSTPTEEIATPTEGTADEATN